ncbi:MAG: glutamyl-tRNA reductase [Candidatus Sumerlaeaceae bacterium]
MGILCFGLSHRTAPLSLLERVSFSTDGMDAFLNTLTAPSEVNEAFGLSTCNRTEFYLHAGNVHEALALLLSRLHDERGVDLRPESKQTYFYADEAAMRHLFRVACGVDSLIIGENEILGQMRKAREASADAGYVGPVLDPILLRALDVGRRVRRTTAISKGNVSVASVAATLAARHFPDIAEKRAVVLGAGETAELASRHLAERGMTRITIANRTYERARDLAHIVGARETAFEQIGEALADADIVLCATGAPHFIINEAMVRAAMERRNGQALLLLDLSVPRNVDPCVAALEGVTVHSMESMTQIAEENRLQREAQVERVEQVIGEEIAAFRSAELSRDTSRFVAALHRRTEQLRRGHLDRYGHFFDDQHRDHLESFTSGLTRSLLHELVANLRTLDLETDEGRHRFQVAQELFNITPDDGGD